jgi:hypothetical protein
LAVEQVRSESIARRTVIQLNGFHHGIRDRPGDSCIGRRLPHLAHQTGSFQVLHVVSHRRKRDTMQGGDLQGRHLTAWSQGRAGQVQALVTRALPQGGQLVGNILEGDLARFVGLPVQDHTDAAVAHRINGAHRIRWRRQDDDAISNNVVLLSVRSLNKAARVRHNLGR